MSLFFRRCNYICRSNEGVTLRGTRKTREVGLARQCGVIQLMCENMYITFAAVRIFLPKPGEAAIQMSVDSS